jgi:hypothetical protein
MTVNPTSNNRASQTDQTKQTQTAARQQQKQTKPSGSLPQDTVTLTHSLPQPAAKPAPSAVSANNGSKTNGKQ